MKIYIAILRGINVSSQKKIKMADLKNHFEELNFQSVQTYIQSGNIIFKYKSTKSDSLERMIEKKILEKYGFKVPALVKTPPEIEYIIKNNPFLKDKNKDVNHFYVTFLSGIPLQNNVDKLQTFDYSPEEYILDGKYIFFYSPNGYGNAKMNNNFFEQKLKVNATTRNWKTVNKLFEITK